MRNAIKLIKNNIYFAKLITYFNPHKLNLHPDYQKRAYVMGAVTAALIVFILLRYAWISFFPTELRDQLISAGTRQFESQITLTQPRAMITDRNGYPLAISVPGTSIFLLTRKMPKDTKELTEVSERLDIPLQTLENYAKQKKNFIWLKRQLSFSEMEKIGNIKKWGQFIGTADEPRRIYPEKNLASQLIGFSGADGNGLEGIEKIYNDRIKAKPTKAEVSRDARGNYVISTPGLASKPDSVPQNLQLSIDIAIQDFTEEALAKGVRKAKALGGSAVVMDVQTGEVLAIASYPTYNLNKPQHSSANSRRFRPVMDAIELASTVKPIFIAKALDLGVITPRSIIYAENGRMQIGRRFIHDTHKNGWLTPEEILKVSSNIGTYKIAQKMGREEFYKALMNVGFGRTPSTGLPGEWAGRIHPPSTWSEIRFANMSFGQGFAISPLQLARSYTILGGGGVDHGIHMLKKTGPNKNEIGPELEFVNPKAAKQTIRMLEAVTEEPGGTGRQARIPGVLVAGKTGTAQIWSNKTKSYSERTPVFAGILPSRNPKIAVVVVLDQAQVSNPYGGPLAGPVFAEIGEKTLNYLNSRGLFSFDAYKNLYLKKASYEPTNSF